MVGALKMLVWCVAAILIEAGLSFLGLGVTPPNPSLGGLIFQSRQFMRLAPWMAIFPGVAITLLVVGLNLIGDGLRDVLDPHSYSTGA